MKSKFPVKYALKVITSEKNLIPALIQNVTRRFIIKNFDYARNDNKSSPPLQIGLKLTNRCNMKCKMCAQWGESGYHTGEKVLPLQEEIPLDVYTRMLNEVAKYKPYFYLWGGEPFLYKDIFGLLSAIRERKMISTLVTNGLRLETDAESIIKNGPDFLFLSLDGPKDLHDEIRNYKGLFQKLTNGIKKVQELKKAHKSSTPYIIMFFTISKYNQSYIYDTFKVINELNIDYLMGFYSWFTTQEIGLEHTARMQEKFNCTPLTWKGYVFNDNQIDYKVVHEQITAINNTKFNFPYVFLPNLDTEEIPEYYKNPRATFNYKKCFYPWYVTEIQPNGDVVTCRDFSDYVAGNIKNESILDIFNNEKYCAFRKELKNGLFPICSRCCGLMGL